MKGSEKMQNYVVAAEVAEELGVSKGKAYAIIKQLNEELSEKGYLTLAGKVGNSSSPCHRIWQGVMRMRF